MGGQTCIDCFLTKGDVILLFGVVWQIVSGEVYSICLYQAKVILFVLYVMSKLSTCVLA